MLYLTFDTADEEALFHRLYYKFNRLLYKYAYEILQNHFDTEDALQISWNKISINIKKIGDRAERQQLNFMIIVVKHSAIDLYNKRNPNVVPYEDAFFETEDDGAGVSASVELSDFMVALAQLAPTYRDPLVLMYTYGYSMEEIAGILQISQTNVGTKIYRAKNMLKKIILERRD